MSEERENSAPVETAYLDGAARDYDEKRFSTAAGRTIDRIEQGMLASALESQDKAARVLDVGCGTGRFLLSACEKGCRCEALDASPDMLAEAKKKIAAKYPATVFHLGDAASLPFDDSVFDFVYSIRLLNQTGSADHALNVVSEMIRVAKPGSEILIEFVNHFRPRVAGSRASDGNVYLKPGDVAHAGRKAGASVVKVRGAFFFGMTAQHRVPGLFRSLLNVVERLLCAIFPKLCARCYIRFLKDGE